jgi:hypothetical protein
MKKKFLTWKNNLDLYTWKSTSIILKLILNKQDVREGIRFLCQERERERGLSSGLVGKYTGNFLAT